MDDIRIADFAPSPGGRYRRHGDYSAEWFRDDILVPALRQAIESKERLEVVLDGTSGYASSFLEEVFGGLISRLKPFGRDDIQRYLSIVAREPLYEPYKRLAERYLSNDTAPAQTAA
jgi:hypothetical protein